MLGATCATMNAIYVGRREEYESVLGIKRRVSGYVEMCESRYLTGIDNISKPRGIKYNNTPHVKTFDMRIN